MRSYSGKPIRMTKVGTYEIPLPAYERIVEMDCTGMTSDEIIARIMKHTVPTSLRSVTEIVYHVIAEKQDIHATEEGIRYSPHCTKPRVNDLSARPQSLNEKPLPPSPTPLNFNRNSNKRHPEPPRSMPARQVPSGISISPNSELEIRSPLQNLERDLMVMAYSIPPQTLRRQPKFCR